MNSPATFILIRNRIQDLPDDGGRLRELNTYVKILSEQLTVLNEDTFWAIEEYANDLKLIDDYLKQEPIYSDEYFNQSRQRVLRTLIGLIQVAGGRLDIIPEKDYKDNFRDQLDLYLAAYELDHIGFFKLQPMKSKTYYSHGRLRDSLFISGHRRVIFNSDCPLTDKMKEDISESVKFLDEKYNG